MALIILLLSIIVPTVALSIGVAIETFAKEDDSEIVFWGDKLCLISISATVSLSYVFYLKLINLDSPGNSQPIIFLIFIIPVLHLMAHFYWLIKSVYHHQKRGKTGRGNFIGILSMSTQTIICLFYNGLFQLFMKNLK